MSEPAPSLLPPERTYGPLEAALRRELRLFFGRLSLMPAVAFIAAGLCLWAYDTYGSLRFFERVWARILGLSHANAEMGSFFYWYGSAFLVLMLVPIVIVRVTNRFAKPEDRVASLGLGLGEWRVGVPACAIFYGVMVVLLVGVVWTQDFRGKYPLYDDADRSLAMFLSYELAYALYFVAWEFFFRGFMTFTLEKSLGIWAIFVQMLPFVVMHFGKPDLESMSSVFGGIALGYLALRTRSIWYGVFIHAATAVTLDVLIVGLRYYEGSKPF